MLVSKRNLKKFKQKEHYTEGLKGEVRIKNVLNDYVVMENSNKAERPSTNHQNNGEINLLGRV